MPRRRNTGSGSLYRPTFKTATGTTKHVKVWWLAYSVDGRRRYESTGCERKADAEAILHRRLAARALGERKAKGAPLTVKELTAFVVADYEAHGRRTVDRVKLSAAHLITILGAETHAASVDEATITAYIAQRQGQGAAAATINRELACLRRAFRLAVRSRRLERRPDFEILTERNARQGFFEDDQYRAVLRHLDADLRPVIEVAYLTGWRVRSEILTRQRRHLDLAAGWLRLEPGETKNGRGRMFPLTAELRRVLEAQVARTEELERKEGRVIPWLFHESGRPFGSFRKRWITACRKAGCPGKIPHDFRRTAVRNLDRAAVPRSAAMEMIGHQTESIYRRYSVVNEATLLEASAKLDAFEINTSRRRQRAKKD